jgi:dipeptidyl aminopeptidase/acylaminoacyl peptidase
MKRASHAVTLLLVACTWAAVSPTERGWAAGSTDAAATSAPAATGYQKPPQAVEDVLNAPPFPVPSQSPRQDAFLLLYGDPYPPLSDLSEPMLRLAGVRLNPNTNGQHRAPYWTRLTYLTFADGKEREVRLPAGARIGAPAWSADGTRFALTVTKPDGIELWVGDVSTLAPRRVEGVRVNAALGASVKWISNEPKLLVRVVPESRPAPPATTGVPIGPVILEGSGKHGIGSTYETRDVLRGPRDEELFDYFMTSQLAVVDAVSGAVTRLGAPAIYSNPSASPDGKYLVVERIHRPYSYLHTHQRFPRDIEIWDQGGHRIRTLASVPLSDQVPIQGVPMGPRELEWHATDPATLVWAEALDQGDPMVKVPHRDRLLTFSAPFEGGPREILRLENRFEGIWYGESGSDEIVAEYDRERRWERVQWIRRGSGSVTTKVLWEQSVNEKYADPGSPALRYTPRGSLAFHQDGDWIWLYGAGSSPAGDRPFLDRYNLRTGANERVFRSDPDVFETYSGMLDAKRTTFLTRRESPTDPPNFYARTLGAAIRNAAKGEPHRKSSRRPITKFPDPTPQLRGIKREIVTYTRADGVPLSFTLMLPPGYREGTRLPTVMYAYPLEHSDASTAGQVAGSERRFTTINGASHLFFLLQGYAVLNSTTMPVIAHPDSVYNDFVEQLVSSAKAAVDKAVALGVTDPERVGIMGHSHGGRMAATLLAHSDLFRAGIARSGAYNQTLVPFGFQGERRTFFDAPDTYLRVSAFRYANRIDEPLLLILGEADANPGTIPYQSDLMYRAIVGTGGTARLVMLPLESHGYEARESIEHTLWEMLTWFDRYVKNAGPRIGAGGSAPGETSP